MEIRVYVDSIIVINYPGLARWISLDRFAVGKAWARKYRNRRIGEMFKEIELSEKQGTGITKILMELEKNDSPAPGYEMDDDRTYLAVTIRRREGFERKMMSESMSELEKERIGQVLVYLESHMNISSREAAYLLNIQNKTAARLLAKAEKLDILESTGRTRMRSYSLREHPVEGN